MSPPLVLVSCRVDLHAEIDEARDALDQRLSALLVHAGLLPVLVPNLPESAHALVERLRPDGLVLSGGNDLVSVGGDRPERDATERALVESVLRCSLPVLGICRGAQLLAVHLGGEVARVDGHVRVRHPLVDGTGCTIREVNSYHAFAVRKEPPGFEVLARASDGTVEWMRSADRRVQAVAWHPERDPVPSPVDLALLRDHFGTS